MARMKDESLRRTDFINGLESSSDGTSSSMPSVAVSWTGGKDSSLALYETEMSGYRINCLVTFVNERSTTPLDTVMRSYRTLRPVHVSDIT